MRLTDSIEIGDLATTPEGYRVGRAILARTGIQQYRASELGDAFADRDPSSIVRLYRPPEEVFSEAALDSIAGQPITIDHPQDHVSVDTAEREFVGFVGDNVRREGDFVVANVRVTHRRGIEAIDAGLEQVSLGYEMELDVTPGITADGESYDGIQRQIRVNHVALVRRGRCGPICRFQTGDAKDGGECSCTNPDEVTRWPVRRRGRAA